MCEDIAPREMESRLEMLDRAAALEVEVDEALALGRGNVPELRSTKDFLVERRLKLEAMVGDLNNRYILVTPYAEVLREAMH